MELRVATWADVDACFDVQRRSAVVGYARIFPQNEYPFPDEIVHKEWVNRLSDDRWVLMALVDGEPVGTIATLGNRVESLFVVPEQWGTGVSDALHNSALERIAAQGAAVAELEVLSDNLRARRFYERRGWERDGREEVSPFPPYPPLVGYRRLLDPVSRSKA